MLLAFGNYIHVRFWVLGLIYAVTLLDKKGVSSQYEFDACELVNHSVGICRIFQECQELVDSLKRGDITIEDPVRCGFKGDKELVCCPGSGGNLETKGGRQPIFDENDAVQATTEKPVDISVPLPTTATTAKPDFWLHLLNSTTTTTTTTTAKPDFWLHLLSSTTTTTTTTTTPKPLVIDGRELDTDAEMYDFSKLLNQNKKAENLKIGEQNPTNTQPSFSGNEGEHLAGNEQNNGFPNVPQSVNANGAENAFVTGNEYAGDFGNVPGSFFGNGRGHRRRNGFGMNGFTNGPSNGFGGRIGHENGFVNGPWRQGTQFQNRHVNNLMPPQGHTSLVSPNQIPQQLQPLPYGNDGIRANLLARPSNQQTFNPGNGPDYVGRGFVNGHRGRGNQFQYQNINSSPHPAFLPSQFQQQPFVNEDPKGNPFLTSVLPTIDQNNIDTSASNNLLYSPQASAVQALPSGQIWNNQNQINLPAPNPAQLAFHNQANENSAPEFLPHVNDNIQNIFYTSPIAEKPAVSNTFLPFEYQPQPNENLLSSAKNFDVEQWTGVPVRTQSSKTTQSTTVTAIVTPASKRPTTISRTERPAVAACRAIEEGLNPILTPHILDGTPVNPGEYPHMAAIGYSDIGNEGGPYDFRCGGTLIHERFVLTAAHCVNSRNITPAIVRLGMSNFDDPEELPHRVEMPIKAVFIHPNYSNSRKYDDIALLELQRDAPLGEFIYPTCLYTDLNDPPMDSKLYVSGWGTVNTRTRKNSRILLKARLQIEPLDNCNSSYVEYGLTRQLDRGLERTQLCARDPGYTKDACQGDSGGPLNMVTDESTKSFRIVGVISTGFGCASAIPGLYTRVASYLDFIEALVWPTI